MAILLQRKSMQEEGTAITSDLLTPESLKPFLTDCGYQSTLLVDDYQYETVHVPLAAFAHQPTDIRSACVAVVNAAGDPASTVMQYRNLGAPVLFVCYEGQIQWWRQGIENPQYLETLAASELPRFFQEHQRSLAPHSIYRAKTRGRFENGYQLDFVDFGLMPLVEREIGQRLSTLVERVIIDMRNDLKPQEMTTNLSRWLFQSVFWLLAAKILRDKYVPTFRSLDLVDIDEVFSRIATHYGTAPYQHIQGQQERQALSAAAHTFAQFSHLGHVTTESLAYVYENTLISKEMRSQLGIHSTPSYLVDYIVWRLAPWIDEIPLADRHIFEPACGHAAFLVAAMRLLKDLHPSAASGQYLRQRLHGIDVEDFALEIARLSLTLADIPNPDGWDVRQADMFVSEASERLANRAMVLLANPPFEKFRQSDKDRYARLSDTPTYVNKTAELLYRVLPHLRPGAVFGVVIPQGLLQSKNASTLRAFIAREFEIAEICLFPDKIFTFSDMESAILLGRRIPQPAKAMGRVRYQRVREPDAERFKQSYTATIERLVPQTHFIASANTSLYIPELEEVWEWCRHLPQLAQFAEIGKGLEYKGKGLPADAQTPSRFPFPGAVRGFARVTPDLQIDSQPPEYWMSIDPTVIRRPGTGTTTGVPQILLNYAPVSRSPWRLKAIVDREGHAVTSRFLTLRPRTKSYPLEFFWGLCNSPFANAYVYAHTGKRDVLVGMMRTMPVPHLAASAVQRVVEAVHAYFEAVAPSVSRGVTFAFDLHAACTLLQHVDAEILRLYDLPPRLERQLLDLFSGYERLGVPFDFRRYFPEDFAPCFPLYVYLSEEYQRSTAGALRKRYKPVTDPAILAALEHAVEAFKE